MMCPRDLFSWASEGEAAAQAAAAEAERARAQLEVFRAPHGKVETRRARLRAATRTALAAEVALERARTEAERP